jgi:hypothetical protein
VPKVYTLTIQNRIAATVFAVAILGLGAVFFTLGLALLAGLAVAGGVIGAGYSLLRRVRGKAASDSSSLPGAREELNPMFEVQPTRPAIVRSAENDPR